MTSRQYGSRNGVGLRLYSLLEPPPIREVRLRSRGRDLVTLGVEAPIPVMRYALEEAFKSWHNVLRLVLTQRPRLTDGVCLSDGSWCFEHHVKTAQLLNNALTWSVSALN